MLFCVIQGKNKVNDVNDVMPVSLRANGHNIKGNAIYNQLCTS